MLQIATPIWALSSATAPVTSWDPTLSSRCHCAGFDETAAGIYVEHCHRLVY